LARLAFFESGETMTRDEAEMLAIEGLQYIAAHEAELDRFIALTGISPSDLQEAAQSPLFLSGILDYFLGEEATLIAFATARGRKPQDIPLAREILSRAAHGS
jgi:hypothetical protein